MSQSGLKENNEFQGQFSTKTNSSNKSFFLYLETYFDTGTQITKVSNQKNTEQPGFFVAETLFLVKDVLFLIVM